MQYVVFVVLLCLGAGSYVTENNKLITVFSSTAEHEQSGPEPLVFNYLAERLDGYQIQRVHAGVERSLQLLSNLAEGCVRNVVKNPARELLFDYSLPETLFLGIKVYLSPRASGLIEANDKDTVELVEFAKQHKLVVGIDKERSYGAFIDNELARLPDPNKYVKEGNESEDRMARMLFSNRIDLWLEYQTVMDLYQQEYLKDVALQSYYVSGAARSVFSHIACKKTADSPELIKQINQLLSAFYHEDSYYQAHIQFVSAQLKNEFDQMFKLFLAER